MGPIGSPLSKIGVQITDSNYVLLSMRIMTRVSKDIWRHLRHDEEFVKCLHSVGELKIKNIDFSSKTFLFYINKVCHAHIHKKLSIIGHVIQKRLL